LYFFYQYITLAVSKWWRDVFQLFDKVIGYLLVKLCHVEFAASFDWGFDPPNLFFPEKSGTLV